MEKVGILYSKSEDFAVRIINLYKYLKSKKKEFALSNQILRSGTSIVANLSEARCAISSKDWLAKVYIAFKECAETECWLKLLFKTDFIDSKQYESLYADCLEIKKMLSSATKTAKEKITPTS